jgi:hypothetical protein
MCTNMYKASLWKHVEETADLQREISSEFSLGYKNNIDYQTFVLNVQETCAEYFDTVMDERTLYCLWFKARLFRGHWQKPTRRSDSSMLWTAFTFGLSRREGQIIIIAWWKKHGRVVSEVEYAEWDRRVVGPRWNEAEPRIKAYQESKLKKQHGKLTFRIGDELKKGRSTPRTLARALHVTVDAVESALRRMVKSGTIVKPADSWGLYELAATAGLQVPAEAVEVTEEPLVAVVDALVQEIIVAKGKIMHWMDWRDINELVNNEFLRLKSALSLGRSKLDPGTRSDFQILWDSVDLGADWLPGGV